MRYSVDEIPAGEFGSKAFRLTKHAADGAVYDVIHDVHGCVACDCPSYEKTHRGTSSMCKHGRALVELGLMPAPLAPVEAPTVNRDNITVDGAAPAPIAHVPDEFDAPAGPPTLMANLPQAIPAPAAEPPAPCCEPSEPSEPAPCMACEPAPVEADTPATNPCCDPDDDTWCLECSNSDPSTWPAWTDADVWAPTPEIDPTPESANAELLAGVREVEATKPALSLAELVDAQARAYRAWPLAAGEMIARALDELALRIRLVDVTTPDEYEARVEVLDREAREQWIAIGFEEGKASCPCHDTYAGTAFGHSA